jgi:uncharacterized membrane protein
MPAKGRKMEKSTYLARLIGPVLAIVGLGFLVRHAEFVGVFQDVASNPTLIFVMCVLGLLGGTALILAHNIWAMDWRAIITVLGWWSAVESAVWLIVPNATLRDIVLPLLTSALALSYGVFVLLLGGVLIYFGYLAPRQATGPRGRHP